jgi:predicted HD superfamily hydrolase involved in NAD metabolism
MWNENEILKYLQNNLNKQRYEHSLRVRDTSIALAEHYGADISKAKIAGLVHDCAKNMEDEEIINIIEKNGYTIEGIYRRTPNLMHGLAAAIIAEKDMGIKDIDILNSINYHTTGRKNMSLLEKIIYISDYIEPMRNFPGVEELRKATYYNLDEALLLSLDNTIKYVISRNQLLHTDTVEARNYILYNKM